MCNGKEQTNKKGNIRYLLNQQLSLSPADLSEAPMQTWDFRQIFTTCI